MDDPGNLIYIAFLVISLIAGWLKNRKKKDERSIPPVEMPPVVPEVSSEPVDDWSLNVEQLRSDAFEAKPIQKSNKVTERPKVSSIEHVEEEQDVMEEDIEVEEFDLRKAVIYSEIIKRPEI